MDDERADRQTEIYSNIWLDVYLMASFLIICYVSSEWFCDILNVNTQWVSRHKHPSYRQLMSVYFSWCKLLTTDVNLCFEAMRICFPKCMSCVIWIIVTWKNCCKWICRQTISFHLVLDNGCISLDDDRKNQETETSSHISPPYVNYVHLQKW